MPAKRRSYCNCKKLSKNVDRVGAVDNSQFKMCFSSRGAAELPIVRDRREQDWLQGGNET